MKVKPKLIEKRASQCESIRQFLERGGRLTQMDCIKRGWGLRLSARIKDLRHDGLDIETKMVNVKCADGTVSRVARYSVR